ncbi:MAG: Npun_F0813 family protein [Phormidesmis sp.]
MFLLTPEDVEITSIQHPRRGQKVPILSYQNKTFRLLSVFGAHQQAEARTSWQTFGENQSKVCVLLEEPHRYSVWRLVRIDKGLLESAAPASYIKACLLMTQSLYSDIEQLLGSDQAEQFGVALATSTTRQMSAVGGFEAMLRIAPLTEALPQWDDADISTLLLALHRLGTQFFGRSRFTKQTLSALKALPSKDNAAFTDWLQRSLISNLWLSRRV